jgi:hypothetical protein
LITSRPHDLLVAVSLGAGAPDQYASCISDKLIPAYTVAQLSDPQFGRNDFPARGKVLSKAAACRT